MQKSSLATIINFCSNEARFLKPCIEQARLFSRQIIIPVCDHLFDGSLERRELLDSIYAAFPDCKFIEYPFIPRQIPARFFKAVNPNHFWHSLSRFIGVSALEDGIDTVLFLDADEIPDGRKFSEWLMSSDYRHHLVLKLANYWYFREPIYQATHWEDSAVLVQRRALSPDLLLHEKERDALYDLLPGPKRRLVTDSEGNPMFHHYSWVRTKEEMLKKVEAWGHRGDRNWKELVEWEFSAPFKGKDFVHGYSYQTIQPPFDIHLGEVRFEPQKPQLASFNRMTKEDLLQLLQFQSWDIWEWLSKAFNR